MRISITALMAGSVLAVSSLVLNPSKMILAQETLVEIHGYVDLTYFDFQKEGDPVLPFTDGGGIPTFDNNHLTLYFGANLTEDVKFVSEFHYEHSIEEPELPQANVQWRLGEPLTLTFGRFWLPFGTLGKDKIHQPTAEAVSYPYTISRALPFHNADNGVKLSGEVNRISYEIALTNGFAGLDEEGGILLRGLAQDNNRNKRATGRVAFHPIEDLELGASHTTGAWDDEDEADISLWGVDAKYELDRLEIEAEYVGGRLENPDDAVVTVNGTLRCNPTATDPACQEPDALRDHLGPLSPGDHNRTAYYLQVAYQVLKNQLGLHSLEGIVRYDAFFRDEEEDGGDRSRVTVGVNLSPKPHFRLKAEYQVVSEPGDQEAVENNGVMFQAVVDF